MNLLKYLDVLIGLAVVMILLSPAVTGVTQLVLGVCRLRPTALKAGIRDLLLQLGSAPLSEFAWAEIRGDANLPVTIGGISNGTTDSSGVLHVDGPIRATRDALHVSTMPGKKLDVLLAARASVAPEVDSAATAHDGTAKLSYARPALPPRSANVIVVDNRDVQIDATVAWKCGSASGTVRATRNAASSLPLPSVAPIDSKQQFELSVTDGAGNALADCRVRFAFERNTAGDQRLHGTADAHGSCTIKLPKDMTAAFSEHQATMLADCVLLHPMIATPRAKLAQKFRLSAYVKGTVVEREELIRILLEFAASEGSGIDASVKNSDVRDTLRLVLARNGITDAAQTLADIRTRAQELEHSHPGVAAHVRQTMAIIEKAKGDFVGKINNWFDQVMLRVTNRYTFWARIVTVVSALLVAVGLQFDSLDLIKRLSTDDGLRESLLKEAEAYQKHVDELPKNSPDTQPMLDSAKAQLDDVQQHLATLRSGNLAILPDRLPWQSHPQARLQINDSWTPPYPSEYELVVGRRQYTIRPDWDQLSLGAAALPSTLSVFQRAIEGSGAPVEALLDPNNDAELVVRGSGFEDLTFTADGKADSLLTLEDDVLRASVPLSELLRRLPRRASEQNKTGRQVRWQFIVGEQLQAAEFTLQPDSNDDLVPRLLEHVPPRVHAVSSCTPTLQSPLARASLQSGATGDERCAPMSLTFVGDRRAKWLALRSTPGRASSDVLNDHVERVATTARLSRSRLASYLAAKNVSDIRIAGISVCGNDCAEATLDTFAKRINADGYDFVTAVVRPLDTLVLTAKTGDDIQLRYRAGHPETNILNRDIRWIWPDYVDLSVHMFAPGIILTWILLSLGAPFWYEMLKDTLKLRPALAQREEAQRRDRQDDTTKAADAGRAQK